MSHLSILPTMLRDADCLFATLEALGLQPQRGGAVMGFGGECERVDLRLALSDGQWLGWSRQTDGSLALVADLQRISRTQDTKDVLTRITRDYAARHALQAAIEHLPDAILHLHG